MPGINGFAVLSKIKETPSLCNVPFIFMTASSETSDKCKGLNLGAEDYIAKPFRTEELISIIRNKIEKNKLLKFMLLQIKQEYVRELEEMLKLISHGIRSPLCSFLGLISLVDGKQQMTSEELYELMDGIRMSAFRLENLTRDLSSIVHNSVIKYKTL
jgi:two-component system, sensor histidine kinase and response regulator